MSENMCFKDASGNVVAEYCDGHLTVFPADVEATCVQQSPQGAEGKSMVDATFRKWTLQGRNVFVDGVAYHYGVADDYLMWDDVVYSLNLGLAAPNQYVCELTDAQGNHTGWSQPLPDPREDNIDPPDPPVEGDMPQTRGSITGNVLTVQSSAGFKVGDGIIIPATQPRGTKGVGGHYPQRLYANEAEMRSRQNEIPAGGIAGCLDTGRTFGKPPWDATLYNMLDMGHWYLGYIVPRCYFATIQKIEGNKWTMSKSAVVNVADVDVFYDASLAVFDAVERGESNLNRAFPGWTRAAVNGCLIWKNKSGKALTCDAKGSFELFSPPGASCMSVEFHDSTGVVSNFVTLRGNMADQGYGFNWEGTTTNKYSIHGALNDNNAFSPAAFPAGHMFRNSADCKHEDATVIDVPVLATGGHDVGACRSERIDIVQTKPLRQYIQWHAQYASTRSKCALVDIEFDSVALLPGAEAMHGDCDLIRITGRNFTMATNNGHSTIDSPRILLEANCIKPHEGYPIWYQSFTGAGYGAPVMNLNKNAGDWNTSKGITLIDPRVDQSQGYLDSNGCNMPAVAVQELPNFKLPNGLQAVFPDTRVQNSQYGCGAVGLQCYGKKAHIDGHVKVRGACENARNVYMVFVTDGVKGSNLNLDVPPGGVSFNWTISDAEQYAGPYEAGTRRFLDLMRKLLGRDSGFFDGPAP